MRKKNIEEETSDLKRLRKRIDRWRQTRRKRSPMPKALWDEAARLAEVHGVSPVSRQVGVDYSSLKNRTKKASKKQRGQRSETEFVELSTNQLLGGIGGPAVVEVACDDGVRLTVRYDDSRQLDVAGLVATFCGVGTGRRT